MKELSEKAKVIDVVKQMVADGQVSQDIAEKYFPELREKESEDERIRKALINGFNKLDKSAVWYNGITNGQIVAWLEKQGEQKPAIIIPKFRVGDEIKTTNEAPLTITKITDSGYWSEDLFICSFDNTDKWELVEQKPTDKVEPKFKVGDWVTIKE